MEKKERKVPLPSQTLGDIHSCFSDHAHFLIAIGKQITASGPSPLFFPINSISIILIVCWMRMGTGYGYFKTHKLECLLSRLLRNRHSYVYMPERPDA